MADLSASGERPPKRPRAARACELCRAKKYRCNERDPCSRCMKLQIECVYKNANSFRQRMSSDPRSQPPWSEPVGPDRGSARKDRATAASNDRSADRGTAPAHRNADHHEGEVVEVNPHTLNREFHGPSSSLAFLAALQRGDPQRLGVSPELGTQALVSAFHNDSFSPQSAPNSDDDSFLLTRYYFRQSQCFLDGYFQNIHFIHPIIDRSQFLSRCEDLWFGRHEAQSRSFVALYFAVMSLGALVREWDEDTIDGFGRWDWSRKLFQLASLSMGGLPLKIDLETIQASVIMAKVCQNELNPHLAYTYLGFAVRTSLSAGLNRQSPSDTSAARSSEDSAISKTWWGLYSVEVETSFSLGRPDSLGPDIYHNRALPPITESESAILTPMVNFARIVRKVSAYVYTTATTIDQRIDSAAEIEEELDHWVATLPKSIRPQFNESTDNISLTKDPKWAKKQRHTLRFRYYNILMVLYRPFLLYLGRTPTLATNASRERLNHAVSKGVAAARSTIRLMHHMYTTDSYFRTWWYNTTYTLYAASIIFGYRTRLAPSAERAELLQLINMSIEILHAMDEHVVSRKAARLLQLTSDRVQENDDSTAARTPRPEDAINHGSRATSGGDNLHDYRTLDFLLDPVADENFDLMAQLFSMDEYRVFTGD